mmetsp:Transcript_69988/g.217306  ORF Transcript_69988/g.217306 Transcript_69988/m.217306 type:complete len:267 (+) Transcript_69988:645-1445(+)
MEAASSAGHLLQSRSVFLLGVHLRLAQQLAPQARPGRAVAPRRAGLPPRALEGQDLRALRRAPGVRAGAEARGVRCARLVQHLLEAGEQATFELEDVLSIHAGVLPRRDPLGGIHKVLPAFLVRKGPVPHVEVVLVLVPEETLLVLKKVLLRLPQVVAADLHDTPKERHEGVLPAADLVVVVHVVDVARAGVRVTGPAGWQGTLQADLSDPSKLLILAGVNAQLLLERRDSIALGGLHACQPNITWPWRCRAPSATLLHWAELSMQ